MTIQDFLPKFIRRVIADRARQTITSEYWNELFNLLVNQGDWGQEAIQLIMTKLNEDVLFKSNTDAWVPTDNFNPATRKFVTDQIAYMGGGNMLKSVYDINDTGSIDNSKKLDGKDVNYFAQASVLADLITAYNASVTSNNNRNDSQDTNITTLTTDLAKFKLTQQYPMKEIDMYVGPVSSVGGNRILATLPLERIYNYASINLRIGTIYDDNTRLDTCSDMLFFNYVITPGFKQVINIELTNTIPLLTGGDIVRGNSNIESVYGYVGNVLTTFNPWNGNFKLGVEQVGTNLLLKVYGEPTPSTRWRYSYRATGKLW